MSLSALKSFTQHRAKKGKLTDVVFLAEIDQLAFRDLDIWLCHSFIPRVKLKPLPQTVHGLYQLS